MVEELNAMQCEPLVDLDVGGQMFRVARAHLDSTSPGAYPPRQTGTVGSVGAHFSENPTHFPA